MDASESLLWRYNLDHVTITGQVTLPLIKINRQVDCVLIIVIEASARPLSTPKEVQQRTSLVRLIPPWYNTLVKNEDSHVICHSVLNIICQAKSIECVILYCINYTNFPICFVCHIFHQYGSKRASNSNANIILNDMEITREPLNRMNGITDQANFENVKFPLETCYALRKFIWE